MSNGSEKNVGKMNTIKKKSVQICILILCLAFCSCIFSESDPEHKKKFKETFEIELTPDIKDIHYYGDFFAIDFTVLLAFTCDSSTIWRIVNEKGLELADENDRRGVSFDFNWWNKDKINTIRPYTKKVKYNEVHQYLWYDKDNQKAYYQKFSM